MKSTLVAISAAVVTVAAVACSSDNATGPKGPKGPDASCVVGTLSVGSIKTGDLSKTASSCTYPLFYDSAKTGLAQSWNFGTQAGKGYLISMVADWGHSALESQLSLIGTTAGAPATLGFAWYDSTWASTIPFVATATTSYSVRVGAYDSTSADTGAYTLRAQTCKVPLATITDSVSHVDSVGPGDCVDPSGDYAGLDSSYVHLYTVQFDSAQTRQITVIAGDSSLAFNIGGPGFDPYGYFGGYGAPGGQPNYGGTYLNEYRVMNGTYFLTSTKAGVYTLVVGTTAFSPANHSYTLIVGNEQPAPSRVPAGTPRALGSSKLQVRVR